MVPKLLAKRSHFQGTAQYLLHDIGAKTNQRVAWTEVRNVSSRNAQVAWRVMAATALNQNRLKQQAGIPNTGRKSDLCALHMSLSWHPDEAPTLNRQEMMRAVNTILRVMGAQEHQCLVVAHNDGVPHCHVLLNRVHPTDGRILSSSYEKLKASRWAEQYEKERGKIYCEQRVLNNQTRKRRKMARGDKDLPRHVRDKVHSIKNSKLRQQVLAKHRLQSTRLKQLGKSLKEVHAAALTKLKDKYDTIRKQINENTLAAISFNKSQIEAAYQPAFTALHYQQQDDMRAFEEREKTYLGRVNNALKSIDIKRVLGVAKQQQPGKTAGVKDAFNADARKEAKVAEQKAAKKNLEQEQKRAELKAAKLRRAERAQYLAEAREQYLAEGVSLNAKHTQDLARIKNLWLRKDRGMRKQVMRLRAVELGQNILSQEFDAAAQGMEASKQTETGSTRPLKPRETTRPNDLLPKQNQEQAARQIDDWQKLKEERFGNRLDRSRGFDEDRER